MMKSIRRRSHIPAGASQESYRARRPGTSGVSGPRPVEAATESPISRGISLAVDEPFDGLDGPEVLGGDVLVADLDAERLLQEGDELEDAQRVDDPAVDEGLVVGDRGETARGRQGAQDEVADLGRHHAALAGASGCSRPPRSTLPVEVLGSAARASIVSGTM